MAHALRSPLMVDWTVPLNSFLYLFLSSFSIPISVSLSESLCLSVCLSVSLSLSLSVSLSHSLALSRSLISLSRSLDLSLARSLSIPVSYPLSLFLSFSLSLVSGLPAYLSLPTPPSLTFVLSSFFFCLITLFPSKHHSLTLQLLTSSLSIPLSSTLCLSILIILLSIT